MPQRIMIDSCACRWTGLACDWLGMWNHTAAAWLVQMSIKILSTDFYCHNWVCATLRGHGNVASICMEETSGAILR